TCAAELHEHRPLGVVGPAPPEADRPQLVGAAAVGAGRGGYGRGCSRDGHDSPADEGGPTPAHARRRRARGAAAPTRTPAPPPGRQGTPATAPTCTALGNTARFHRTLQHSPAHNRWAGPRRALQSAVKPRGVAKCGESGRGV